MTDKFPLKNMIEEKEEDVGIRFARDMDAMEDERMISNARIQALNLIVDDHRQIIYYLVSKLYPGRMVTSIDAFFEDKQITPIDKPKEKTLHHVEIKTEV